MRLRHKPQALPTLRAAPNVVRRPDGWPGHWRLLFFHRPGPLYVEIGCGRGRFIREAAMRDPEALFIGLERKAEALYVAWRRVEEAGLSNVGFIFDDAANVAAYFAPMEIDRLYLNFSDPWPKKRHAKRRLTHPRALARLSPLLRPGGELWLKTDNAPFFDFSVDSLKAYGYVPVRSETIHGGEPQGPVTDYEAKFLAAGQPIYHAVFRWEG